MIERSAMTEVLVVGAGPTGLVAGCLLRGYGIATRIVDRLPGPSTLAKAMVVWPRSLEVLDEIGVSTGLAAEGIPLVVARYSDRSGTLAAVRTNRIRDSRWQPVILPQHRLEALLRERYLALGGALDWGTRLVHAAVVAGHVEAVLAGPAGEAVSRVPYLVGCDGTRSTVRDSCGIGVVDSDPHEGTFLLGDVSAQSTLDRTTVHHFLGRNGFTVLIPMPGGQWRMIGFLDGYEPADVDRAALDRVLTACDHTGTEIREVGWSGTFRVTRRLATTFRHGRVLIAGDAAHVHSPAGGQGLNTGMQDAHNLAWKLALVVRGSAGGTLLDSYHAERAPVAAGILRITRRQDEWIVGVRSPVARALRNTVMRLLSRTGWPERSVVPDLAQLRVDYGRSRLSAGRPARWRVLYRALHWRAPRPGVRIEPEAAPPDGTARTTLWLVGEAGAGERDALWSFAARYPDGLRLAPANPRLARLAGPGFAGQGPLLIGVRPDGHVGYRGPAAVTPELRAWVADALGLIPSSSPVPDRPRGDAVPSGR